MSKELGGLHKVNELAREAGGPRRVLTHTLFAGQKRLIIEHEGVDYVLQITRQGKLILTK